MNRYHTSLKICYALKLQNQFVDKSIRERIPASTSAYWNKLDPQQLIGANISQRIENNLSNIEAAYHPVNTIPRATFHAYCRLMVTITNLLKSEDLHKTLRKHKQVVINTIDSLSEHISYKTVSKLLGITEKTLYHWRTLVKFKCDNSALWLCTQRHPNQATIAEIAVIRKWLSKTELQHWSLHAIWAQAFKTGETALSRNSWYLYNRILKIRTGRQKGTKPKRLPLRASRINEIWHADITVFKTGDGIKHYVYTVMDHYSRFILALRIETVVSAAIRLDTIKAALHHPFGGKTPTHLQLVTDGGPENDNSTIREFIQSANLTHTIALRDIVQSNSMMEAFYHTAKYSCLYRQPVADGRHLQKIFTEFIHEYHFERPHYALGIYTPSEVLNGADLSISHRQTYLQAAIERRKRNKEVTCKTTCQ